jgi:SEC-C motif
MIDSTVELTNIHGQCPQCGSSVTMPSGVYDTLGDVLKIITSPGRTREELRRLEAIIRAAQKYPQKPKALDKKIAKEVPGFAGLSRYIPKTSEALAAWLLVIVTILTLLKEDRPNITEKRVIENTYITNNVTQVVPSPPPTPPKSAGKPGVNHPCPCGSGKKYKHCCRLRDIGAEP